MTLNGQDRILSSCIAIFVFDSMQIHRVATKLQQLKRKCGGGGGGGGNSQQNTGNHVTSMSSNRHHRSIVGGSTSGHNTATNAMLLSVSFYVIFTTLPATLVYVLATAFLEGDRFVELVPASLVAARALSQPSSAAASCVVRIAVDRAWPRFEVFDLVRKIVNELCLSQYACNFLMFFTTGREFRAAVRRTFCEPANSDGWRASMSGGGGASGAFMKSFAGHSRLSTTQIVTVDSGDAVDNHVNPIPGVSSAEENESEKVLLTAV